MQYEPVIGLEIHAQLLTRSKLFCGCSTAFGSGPNTNVCPTCLGLPGSLPVANERAIRFAVRAALALDCRINERSIFARKQYFYPDLPKGYQISQYEEPYSEHGSLEIEVGGERRTIGVRRVHLEEDAGKNVHGVGGDSLVDLNRAGVPLIEIVSEPDIRSSAEAAEYMRSVRDILMCLGVNDGNLEEGSFRCDANVSIRPKGVETLGTRTELKNLNSFRFVQRAIDVEVARQTAILDAKQNVVQETRAFDPDTGKTRSLRSKEEAHDYRYFPDPDLPPLRISPALITEERDALPELPAARRLRYIDELGLPAAAAGTLTQHPEIVSFFEATLDGYAGSPVKVANFVMTEVLRDAKTHGLSAVFPASAEHVRELVELVDAGDISGKQAKEVYGAVRETGRSPAAIVEERGLKVVSDEATLRPICEELIAASPKQVEQYAAGKKGVLGYFVGQVMKRTRGSADPKVVSQMLEELLDRAR